MTGRIIIVGGGPVGLCAAALLARTLGKAAERITVIDGRQVPALESDDPVDLRVYALSRASQQILNTAGAWDQIAATRLSPFEAMCVWEGDGGPSGAGSLHFDSADVGEPNLGHIVEDGLLRARLFAALADDVEYLPQQQVSDLVVEPDGIKLTLASGAELGASLVVGADGSASVIRQLVGISTVGWSYRQRALVTHVATSRPHDRVAYQRFLPGGPVALLPLADGRSSVVWSAGESRVQALLDMGSEEFCHELTSATGAALGNVESASQRVSFELRLAHAQRYVAQRVVLVGDAAHTVHPLAGQGGNLGLLDAAALAEVLADGLAAGEDPGDRRLLRRYERWRKGDNVRMMLALDGLHRLFGLPVPAFRPLRKAGMSAVNGAGPVKNFLVREALGLATNQPRAARFSPVPQRLQS